MIEIKNLSHSFGTHDVLRDVNLTIEEGNVKGLVGINGAGKSTLLRLIAGVYRPCSGQILFDGEKIHTEAQRARIFFLPDDPYFTIYTTGRSLFDMYRVFYPKMDGSLFEQYVREFDLDLKKPLRRFSKGMRRQMFAALALAVCPDYLLLDEAFDGLDPVSRQTFCQAVNRAVEQNGMSVLIASHSLRELENFCDSYALIDRMTVSASGSIAENVESLCKFQLAFRDVVSQSTFTGLPAVSLESDGRFVSIVLRGRSRDMRAALEALSPTPLVIEERPVNFEELFINQVQHKVEDEASRRINGDTDRTAEKGEQA